MIEPLAQARMRTCGVFRFCMCVVSDYCVLGLLLTDGDFDARQSTPKAKPKLRGFVVGRASVRAPAIHTAREPTARLIPNTRVFPYAKAISQNYTM